MLSYVKQQTVTITIGVSFFVFGFFITANLLHLSERDVLVGLISGAIGGITMLGVSHLQERRSDTVSARIA
jgi:tetrahydromethanopterin S-methyltransferase subunit D